MDGSGRLSAFDGLLRAPYGAKTAEDIIFIGKIFVAVVAHDEKGEHDDRYPRWWWIVVNSRNLGKL